jgi:MFS family permease
MQMAVWVAGPYFTPYMFVHLRLSYAGFMILTCVGFVAKILTLPLSGKVIERWGAKRVLWTSGTLIALVPALWMLDDRYGYLIALQIASGAAWGAYELAMLLLFFEAIPRDKRVSVLTIYNLANASAIVIGSLIGGAVLGVLGTGRPMYLVLFAISAVARVAGLLFLLPVPKLRISSLFIATRPIALRPTTGPIARPILPSLSSDEGTRCENAVPAPARTAAACEAVSC